MMAVAMVSLRYCRSPGSKAPATLQVLNIKRLRITKNERSEFINPTHRRIPLQCVGSCAHAFVARSCANASASAAR